jgi:hypothetical protein
MFPFNPFIRYVHKLKERMSVWRLYKEKMTPIEDLPAEFGEVKGPADAPFAEYSDYVDLEDMLNAQLSPEMQRTLFVQLFAEQLNIAREIEPRHRE